MLDAIVYFERCGCRSLVEISTKLRPPSVEVCSKFRPNVDTPSVETSTKLRPPSVEVCRNFDQTSTPQVSKLRPNFDTPSVEVWSKFARYINEIRCNFEKMPTKLRHQTSTKRRPNFDHTSTKLRPNFDTGGVEVWSKCRPNFDPPVSKFGLIDDDRNNQQLAYLS